MIANQDRKRAELSGKLKEVWANGPEFSYNMNVKSGIFRVAISEDSVTGFLNDEPVQTIKIAELNSNIREALKSNPENAGKLLIEEFINIHKEGKITMKDSITKDAGKAEGTTEQLTSITEKQLDSAGPIHPRQEKERTDITEKQLGDSGYKDYKFTKRVEEEQKDITEKQLEAGKNPNETPSPRTGERTDITEKQLNDGKLSSVNTRRDEEKTSITNKQLEDGGFAKGEIKSITEKQLSGSEQPHDKVYVRKLANKEDALNFAKKVAKSAAKTIVANKLTKEDVINSLKTSTKNFSSQIRVRDLIKKALAEDIDMPINVDEPESVATDVLSDEDVGGSYDADMIVNVIKSLVENPKFSQLIDEAVQQAQDVPEEVSDEDMLNDALGDEEPPMDEEVTDLPADSEPKADADLSVEGDDEDGLTAVEGDLSDLGPETDEGRLASAGFAYARKTAGKQLPENLVEFQFNVNKEENKFRAIFADSTKLGLAVEAGKVNLKEREELREKKVASALGKVKTAQAMPAGGGMPEMAPVGQPAGGGGTTMPPGAPGAGAGEVPPIESFEADKAGEGMEDLATENDPSPPGTRCPNCGSDDVDIENGKFKCNSCRSEGTFSVNIQVNRWSGTLEDTEKAEGSEEGEGEGLGGEGMEAEGEGTEMPAPIAASVYTINSKMIKKAVNSGEGYFRVGGYCPTCGSDNTQVNKQGNGVCFNCSQNYVAKFAKKNDQFKGLVIWQPIVKKPECPECEAKKIASKFLPTTLKKTAKTEEVENKNHKECIEKMARRYGLNAVALAGVCAGKPLADCVCNKMKTANKFSTILMMKLASRLIEKDPTEECIEDKIREGKETREACTECEELKKQALMTYPEEAEVEEVVCCDDGISDGSEIGDEIGGDAEIGGESSGLIYDVDKFEDDVQLDPADALGEQLNRLVSIIKDVADKLENKNPSDEADIVLEDDNNGMDQSGDGSVDQIIENIDNVSDEGSSDVNPEGDSEISLDENNLKDEDTDTVEFELEKEDGDDDDDNNDDNNGGSKPEEDKVEDKESCSAEMDKEGEGMEKETGKKKNNPFEKKDEKSESDEPKKESDSEDEECEGCDDENCTCKGKKKGENKEDGENKENKDADEDKDEDKEKGFAKFMSSNTIKRYSDTDSLKTLTAKDTMQINDILGDRKIGDTASEKEVTIERSQDVKDIGKVSDGKTLGKEEKFDAKKPDVPQRGNGSKMGDGESIPEGKAKVPAGKGAMGTEDKTIDTKVTVTQDGISKGTATSATDKKVKVAGEKQVGDPKPVDQSKDLKGQKLKDKNEMGKERETKLTPDTLEEPDVPRTNEKMGPDESKDFETPKVPAGGGGMGKENETVGTEVSLETKGTIIAKEDARITEAKVRSERIKLATKLAALELIDGQIAEKEYNDEVEKLASSSVPTLKTLIDRYEKQRAKVIANKPAVKRIASEETDIGLETPLLISKEANNQTLKDKLQGMFSLDKKIKDFEENNK